MNLQTTQQADLATPLFRLGRCVATIGVDDLICCGALNPHELLRRHQCGDWGDLDESDKRLNSLALRDRSRLMSVYKVDSATVWVITDANWEVTTLLLPSEY